MNVKTALAGLLLIASSATFTVKAETGAMQMAPLDQTFSPFAQEVGGQRKSKTALPDPDLTPGHVCTPQDPDFDKFDYTEKIARCRRHFTIGDKQKVADSYGGIPREEWKKYEFDHMIPLCAGGSNDLRNVWPEPIEQADRKDILENQICLALRAGTMSQAEALQKVYDWFNDERNLGYAAPMGFGEQ